MATFAFNANYYRTKYDDLLHLSAEDVEVHFFNLGIGEGRVGAKGGLREDFVQRIPQNVPVLEFGPFASPVARGGNVRYAEVL